MGVHKMWDKYPVLKRELTEVSQLIISSIHIRDEAIEKKIKTMIQSGGKMLRPAYTLLCAQIGPEQDPERTKAVAAALECLHLATLVHDDVIDQADTRHGQTTINTAYGNKLAIYTGDYLLTLAFSMLSHYADSAPQIKFRGFEADKILAGELTQLHGQFQTSVSVKRYLAQISGKTAQLFAISCYAGALSSQAKEKNARHAWYLGHYFGMAFQIIDDLLDYKGKSELLGKPAMNDLNQGIYTLPLIYALKADPQKLGLLLQKRNTLTDADMVAVLEIIEKHHGYEKALSLARRYTQKALKELHVLPDGTYKAILKELTQDLLDRTM